MALLKEYSSKNSVCKITFELSAKKVAGAKTVALLGSFNGWNATTHPLAKQKNGNFATSIEVAVGHRYEFRYLIDGHHWLNDEEGDAYVSSRVSFEDNFVVIIDAPKVKTASAKIIAKPLTKETPKAKTSVKAEPKAKVETPKVASKVTKSVAAKAIKPVIAKTKTDDLTIIEGIGPKAAKVLIAAGIASFEALSKAKAVAVKEILTAATEKVGHLDPTTWAKQAKLAASGKFAELETLKKELNNGKVVK